MIIDVVAPGYGGKKEDIALVGAYLKKLGFTPRIPKDIFAAHPLHSNDDAYRLNHLVKALKAEDSAAVWCFKGGYGTAKLLAPLAKIKPPKEKLLVGFSDITALHLFLTQEWGWSTLHAPVLWQLIRGKVEAASGQKVAAYIKGKHSPKFRLAPMNKAAQDYCGMAEITGGNLALLQSSVGTAWQVNARRQFLFIEEVDEQAYRIDRMFLHLKQAGLFGGVKAILLGDFTFTTAPAELRKIEATLSRFAAETTLPVFRLTDIGHGTVNNPLPFGKKAEIKGKSLVAAG